MSINTVMVIGAGQMGGGIAQVMAAAGRKTYLNDVNMDIVKSRLPFRIPLINAGVLKYLHEHITNLLMQDFHNIFLLS